MNSFFFALTFLTRIPLPFQIKYTEELPSKSLTFYPTIGTIIGIVIVLLNNVFSYFLSDNLTNILVLIGLVYITGGLHLDGLIDTIDGIFSCRKKERMLEIMHDSLVGAFGAIGIFLFLLLKYNLLLELKGDFRIPILILMPAISRWMIVFAAYRYPLAISSKLGKGFNYYLGWKEIGLASGSLIGLFIIIMYLFSFPLYLELILFFCSWLITVYFSHYIKGKIDGLTGDIYGAINEISEVIVLIAFLVVSKIY